MLDRLRLKLRNTTHAAWLLSTLLFCFVVAVNTAHGATTVLLSDDPLSSDVSGFGGSVVGTLSDTFAYDPLNPTSPLPAQGFSGGNGFHGNEAPGEIVDIAYTINGGDVTLSAFELLFIDLYGRDDRLAAAGGDDDRDDDFDVNLYDNGVLVATAAGLAIPGPADFFHLRIDNSDFNVSLIGLPFDAIRIAARDSNGLADNNFFTLQEIRAAIVTIPEPHSYLLGLFGSLAVAMLVWRRRSGK